MKVSLRTVVFSFRWSNGATVTVNWIKKQESGKHSDAVWKVVITGYIKAFETTLKPNQTNSIYLAKKVIK